MKPYYVKPCDDGGSLPDAPRTRSWDVVLRRRGGNVAIENYVTRKAARDEAERLNQAAANDAEKAAK